MNIELLDKYKVIEQILSNRIKADILNKTNFSFEYYHYYWILILYYWIKITKTWTFLHIGSHISLQRNFLPNFLYFHIIPCHVIIFSFLHFFSCSCNSFSEIAALFQLLPWQNINLSPWQSINFSPILTLPQNLSSYFYYHRRIQNVF